MMRANNLLGLIQELYAAPGTTHGWHTFLESVRLAMNGSASSLLTQDFKSQECSFGASTVVDAEAIRLYDEQWGPADPWAHSPNSAQLSQRNVIIGDELIAHRDVLRTAYYHDFASRYDLVRAVVGVLEVSPAALTVISISGSDGRGPFGERDAALLEALVPHIRRALQVHRRLIGAESMAADLVSVLDESSQAVFVADSKGRVSFLNRAASRLTGMRDGLTCEHGQLRAAGAGDTTRLRAAVAEAIQTSHGDGLGAGGVLCIGRPSGRRPFAVLVSPMSRPQPSLAGCEAAAAMIFVTDPEQNPLPTEHVLQTLFGLTPAEAKLTRLLAQGASLSDAGALLGLRRETVRSRVKTIFEKTSTHRQAELVRLVLNATPRT